MLKIQEFRERVRASDSVAAVQRALEETFKDLGFEQLSYVVLRAPHGAQRPKILTTFPMDWRSRYVDANYSHFDAVYPAASAFLFPLRWDELYSDFRTTRKQKLIFDEAKDFGIKQGVTVPIHGPAGGLASGGRELAGPRIRVVGLAGVKYFSDVGGGVAVLLE